MINKSLLQNWAEAIFEIYKDKSKIDLLEKECVDLAKLLEKNSEFISLISSMNLDIKTKHLILKEVFKNHISIDLFNAINLMAEKNIISLIRPIIMDILRIIDSVNNTKHGIVYSVIELDNKQLNKIEAKLSRNLKLKVRLVNQIDEKLIGGIKISIDNIVYDYSIINQLKDIKSEIYATL